MERTTFIVSFVIKYEWVANINVPTSFMILLLHASMKFMALYKYFHYASNALRDGAKIHYKKAHILVYCIDKKKTH